MLHFLGTTNKHSPFFGLWDESLEHLDYLVDIKKLDQKFEEFAPLDPTLAFDFSQRVHKFRQAPEDKE